MNFVNTFLSGLTRSKKKFDRTEKRLLEAHHDLRQFVANVDMCYDDGQIDIPITHNWQSLCDGITQIECQLPTKKSTLLNVVFEVGTTMKRHLHKNQVEEIFVVEGEIEDLENGAVTKQGNVYYIPANQPHTIHAKTRALLNVLFRPKFLCQKFSKDCVERQEALS